LSELTTCRYRTLVGARIAGKQLPVAPAPNTTVPVDLPKMGRVALVLNKQERTPNGTRVTAMELTAPLAHLGPEVMRVSSVTCASGARQGAPGGKVPSGANAPGGANAPAGEKAASGGKAASAAAGKAPSAAGVGEAPRPKPVRHELAVTG
ncbi:choice-of-anchor P family protein, partial [Spirillospora sp. NPDC049652]